MSHAPSYRAERWFGFCLVIFCFISFIGIGSPLTDIVIVHIFYINESNPYTPFMSISHIQICYLEEEEEEEEEEDSYSTIL